MVQNAVGKPVEGDNFFDRKREMQEMWSRLETDDILLLAPRRVGKTSLMYKLRDTAHEHGYQAMYLGVADVASEGAFVRRLFSEIEKHEAGKRVRAAFKKSAAAKLLRRIKKIGFGPATFELSEDVDAEWAAAGESIATALHSLGSRWLLLVDEVPIFILELLRHEDGANRARTFLNWFRALRQSSETSRSIRWFLAGSIGLDTVTRRMNLGDTINDLNIYADFGAFSTQIAYHLLDALADTHSMLLTGDVKARICERVGWLIPFHLQICFAGLRSHCDHREPTLADVDAVYEELLSPAKKAYFDYWHQRLHAELGAPEDRQAIELLDAISQDDEGATADTLRAVLSGHVHKSEEREARFRYLVDVLSSDGYIVDDRGRYRFRSTLLRDYWRRHVS